MNNNEKSNNPKKKKKFLVVNGPNLNLLGIREPQVYGDLTLKQIKEYTCSKLEKYGPEIEWFQSNIEGEIIDRLHLALDSEITALVINPAGYSHTSVAILDALKLITVPIIEVHLSNTVKREEFRQRKLTAQAAQIIIEGAGMNAYYLAIYSQLLNEEE